MGEQELGEEKEAVRTWVPAIKGILEEKMGRGERERHRERRRWHDRPRDEREI
jgi:hypothetical protein